MKSSSDRRATLRIVAIYATFAALWIYFSDHALGLLVHDHETMVQIAVYKGFLFILVTALLLYQLIGRYLRKIRKTEEDLQVNRGLLTSLIEGTTDAVYVKDRQGRYLQFNAAAELFTGRSAAEVLGKDDTLLFPAAESRAIMTGDRQVMDGGRVETYEEYLTTADGMNRTFLSTKGPIYDVAGEVTGLFGIARDITGRKHAELELQEKNAELERFTYTVSHDLKSPLVTIRTYLGYLEQDLGNGDAEKIRKDMQYMRTAAEKMGMMLDDLLEMSRIGRVPNPSTRVTLRELVGEALSLVAGAVAGRGVEVKTEGTDIALFGDRPRLVEIWQNLVENAVKFMGDQPSPRIEIGAEPHGRETVFYVRDNGIGIDPRYRDKVFGLFEKLDAQAEGTGLGLALVKRIVELSQGTIWLESEGLGRGSCFRFTLPAAVQGNVKGGD